MTLSMRVVSSGFNPLFAGLTLKVDELVENTKSIPGFNPLFAGLTLKAVTFSVGVGAAVVSIPYLRG